MLRREGHEVNSKRVQRVRRSEGLQVRKKQRKKRRSDETESKRREAGFKGDVWSWDFVHDQTSIGSRFKMLTLIDEYTRECLTIHVGWSITANDVIKIVARAMEEHGVPNHLRSDNGPEFIAHAIEDWFKDMDIKPLYIKPGSPWEQAYIESFHDKFRDECLNRELFGSLREAGVIVEQWRKEYNHQRPHSSLNNLTPAEFADQCTQVTDREKVLVQKVAHNPPPSPTSWVGPFSPKPDHEQLSAMTETSPRGRQQSLVIETRTNNKQTTSRPQELCF